MTFYDLHVFRMVVNPRKQQVVGQITNFARPSSTYYHTKAQVIE